MFTLIHTSDWHLGRSLYGQNRQAEFAAFLDWLLKQLTHWQSNALLIAGDVFDTITPNHAAQELYYAFLAKVATQSPCRHIVIIGGNHDSASFLNAPQRLLHALNVHVIGAISDKLSDEIIVLNNANGQAEAIVCAVPYLRDRDVRLSLDNQSLTDSHQALLQGIREHYRHIYAQAAHMRAQLDLDIPIIAMGHLFTQGGITLEQDGVRELYVGNVAHVGADCFEGFDYVALGHLHVPQLVAEQQHIRYSGSPIAMGFGEAKQQKSVVRVTFTGRLPTATQEAIPCFQALERIQGDWETIEQRVTELDLANSQAYVEVDYQGTHLISDLNERLKTLFAPTQMQLLRVYNRQFQARILNIRDDDQQTALLDLSPNEVFEACLKQHDIADEQKEQLRLSHQHVLHQVLNSEPST